MNEQKRRFNLAQLWRTVSPWAGGPLLLALVLGAFLCGWWLGSRKASTGQQAAATAEKEPTGDAQEEPTTWTCSMHPQIQQPKPGKCPICGMDLIPVTETGGELPSLRALELSPEAVALLNIETSRVERKYVTAEIRMVGKIDYDETRLAYITAWVPGRLDRLYVDFTGVEVRKGDHMVYMYSPELYSAQEELLLAKQAKMRLGDRAVTGGIDLYAAARERLRQYGMTEEQIKEIELRGKPSDHLTILSPISGIVIEKRLQEGDYVQVGTRIYTVADLTHLWVKLDAYESDLPWVHYGQPVEFYTEAYPGEVFIGHIAFIDPVLNDVTRTVKVRVNLPNPDGKLKPGMFVRGIVRSRVAEGGKVVSFELMGKWICRMHPEILKDQAGSCDVCGMPLVRTESLGYVSETEFEAAKPLVIPVTAALVTGKRAVVYVKLPDTEKPTFEGREILLGPRAGDYYIVKAGLKEGELVVTKGNFKIDAEIQIRARPSMMTPEGGGGEQAGASKPGEADVIKLPPSVRKGLARIAELGKRIIYLTEDKNIHEAKKVAAELAQQIKAIDHSSLPQDKHLAWKEISMLLWNDATEISEISLLSDLSFTVKRQLSVHLEQLHKLFGPALKPVAKFTVPQQFKDQLKDLWTGYVQLQEALAADNLEKAKEAVASLKQIIAAIDASGLEGRAAELWKSELTNLNNSLEQMGKGEKLDEIRHGFALLSDEMSALIVSFDLTNLGPVYQHHCPMAFDGRGAAWLQTDDDTRNPYYGESMLKCADWVEPLIEPEPAKK